MPSRSCTTWSISRRYLSVVIHRIAFHFFRVSFSSLSVSCNRSSFALASFRFLRIVFFDDLVFDFFVPFNPLCSSFVDLGLTDFALGSHSARFLLISVLAFRFRFSPLFFLLFFFFFCFRFLPFARESLRNGNNKVVGLFRFGGRSFPASILGCVGWPTEDVSQLVSSLFCLRCFHSLLLLTCGQHVFFPSCLLL